MFCYFKILRKYLVFSGRSGRLELWCGLVGNILLVLAAMGTEIYLSAEGGSVPGWLTASAIILIFPPWLSLCARRLHDMGRSGWDMFHPLHNLMMPFAKGDEGDNAYGSPPGN